jgi:hypothetical protein
MKSISSVATKALIHYRITCTRRVASLPSKMTLMSTTLTVSKMSQRRVWIDSDQMRESEGEVKSASDLSQRAFHCVSF